jgi:hypothetical protein
MLANKKTSLNFNGLKIPVLSLSIVRIATADSSRTGISESRSPVNIPVITTSTFFGDTKPSPAKLCTTRCAYNNERGWNGIFEQRRGIKLTRARKNAWGLVKSGKTNVASKSSMEPLNFLRWGRMFIPDAIHSTYEHKHWIKCLQARQQCSECHLSGEAAELPVQLEARFRWNTFEQVANWSKYYQTGREFDGKIP